jgi:catechol 2,3-dioxygenase
MIDPAHAAASTHTASLPAETRIGHVHLKVADLDRAVRFYHEVLGFDLVAQLGSAAFLSAGGYHHHIALNTWQSKDGPPPAPGTTGLYHFAVNYPTRRDLARALQRLYEQGWVIDGASDHGTHEAIYLHDPDGNGLELACDRDPSHWRLLQGATIETMQNVRKPLDFESLLAELEDPATVSLLPELRQYT